MLTNLTQFNRDISLNSSIYRQCDRKVKNMITQEATFYIREVSLGALITTTLFIIILSKLCFGEDITIHVNIASNFRYKNLVIFFYICCIFIFIPSLYSHLAVYAILLYQMKHLYFFMLVMEDKLEALIGHCQNTYGSSLYHKMVENKMRDVIRIHILIKR